MALQGNIHDLLDLIKVENGDIWFMTCAVYDTAWVSMVDLERQNLAILRGRCGRNSEHSRIAESKLYVIFFTGLYWPSFPRTRSVLEILFGERHMERPILG